jgi:hypothetical protein
MQAGTYQELKHRGNDHGTPHLQAKESFNWQQQQQWQADVDANSNTSNLMAGRPSNTALRDSLWTTYCRY